MIRGTNDVGADVLAGVRAKIERADHHIREFKTKLRKFSRRRPHILVSQDDPQTGEKIYKLHFRESIPGVLPCIIGDAVHNLRSALDHLAWQLVVLNGNVPSKATAFPIYKTLAEFKAQSPAKVKGMSQAAIDLIEATKPYQGGNDEFWMLHELDIIDKHRLLVVCTVGSNSFEFDPALRGKFVKLSFPDYPRGSHPWEFRLPVLEDGAEIVRVAPFPGLDEMKDEIKLMLEVAFAEPEILKGKPVLQFLHQLISLVERMTLTFEPIF